MIKGKTNYNTQKVEEVKPFTEDQLYIIHQFEMLHTYNYLTHIPKNKQFNYKNEITKTNS